MASLLEKYDVPAPRYTSYPTVPYWEHDHLEAATWLQHVQSAFAQDQRLSVYIHLPFCEQLCTYCGCNKHITKNHAVEAPYIQALLAEWAMYTDALSHPPVLRELHLGGGTPTFFQPDQLGHLLEQLFSTVRLAPDHECSFEAHPASTSVAHLSTLYALGFRRLSIGVQDVDPWILQAINRTQTVEQVTYVAEKARQVGYTSLNFDLVYGLPFQRPEHIRKTVELVAQLRPERIALYSYAHVPWLKNGQRAFDEHDLPDPVAKRGLYELGKELLEALGYHDIGMDHFALPTDALYQAAESGQLHRNFMGYTPVYTPLTIGLGASAIGDTFTAFAQNLKTVADYQAAIQAGRLPLLRGHLLTKTDARIRQHILNLMCRYQTTWQPEDDIDLVSSRLDGPLRDGLATLNEHGVQVTPLGKGFLRNICQGFDMRYWDKQLTGRVFSQAV